MKKETLRINTACRFMLVIILLSVVISGCELYEGPYSFRQDQSNIEKVEICEYESIGKVITPIVVLSDSEAEKIMSELSEMDCFTYFPGDHPREYGPVVICIYYADGEIEVIGSTNIGWISPTGQWSLSNYSYDWEVFEALITSYVGEALLSES